jgi:hypothetical protein
MTKKKITATARIPPAVPPITAPTLRLLEAPDGAAVTEGVIDPEASASGAVVWARAPSPALLVGVAAAFFGEVTTAVVE